MKGFKEKGFAERRETAAKAKQDILKKFEERSSADDPALLERRAARIATAEARKVREAKREEEKAAQKLLLIAQEAEAAAEAEKAAVLKAEREVELEKEQKAIRDARYAARKARK